MRKYIVLNWPDCFYGEGKGNGFNAICFHDFKQKDFIYLNAGPFAHLPLFFRMLYKAYNKLGLSDKFLYPFFTPNKFAKEERCFLFIRLPEIGYMRWLRKKYSGVPFVLYLRDLYDNKRPLVDYYRKECLVDFWLTYDKQDALRYNMNYYHGVESKIECYSRRNDIQYDVCFVGKAKNRLPELLAIYDRLNQAGLKCYFYILKDNVKDDFLREGVVYSDLMLPYSDVLELIMKSRCILELNQEGATGYTARYLETVIYNKKLLTNTVSIKDEPFYNSAFISFFSSATDIDIDFLRRKNEVDFRYNNEFSPLRLIEYVDKIILK